MNDPIAGASLTPGAQLLVQNALSKRQPNQAHLGVHHWLLALVERHGPMAESLAVGVNASALRGYLHQKIQTGDLGPALSADDVTKQAAERATKRGLASAATFEQNIIGSTCDKNELKASVMAVLGTADKYDDEIVARWGGKRSSDR